MSNRLYGFVNHQITDLPPNNPPGADPTYYGAVTLIPNFTGSYNELRDRPVLFGGHYADLVGAPNFSTVAFTGRWGDLVDRPLLSNLAFSGDYRDLRNVPKVMGFSYLDLADKPDLGLVALSNNYADLSNKPNFAPVAFSGQYAQLSGLPVLKTVATSGSYNDLRDQPSFATVAFSADWNDLINRPTLFSGNYFDLTNRPFLFDGNYNNLRNKPSLLDLLALNYSVVTQAIQLAVFERYWVTENLTLPLPASPTTGQWLDVVSTHALGATLDRNGRTIQGRAENLVIDLTNINLRLLFKAGTWEILYLGQVLNAVE
ncbi:MAG: hypothetical protein DDT26_01048 [Dehalococcoidia bacterium]|nr:hypothetical protein [Chloroflexota bacterium]